LTTAAPRAPLSTFWSRRAFSIADRAYLWIDVALAAMAQGDWGAFERRLAAGLACAAEADARPLPLDDEVEEAASAFRYERDLIASADLDKWLEGVGVSTDDWLEYLRRDVLRRMWSADLEQLIDRFPISPRQLQGAAVAEGVCSGAFDAFADAFAGRAALVFSVGSAVLPPGHDESRSADRAVSLARRHRHWMTTRTEGDILPRLAEVLRIEDAFEAASAHVISLGSLSDIVSAHRLDWVVLELDTISFATEPAAREALLCIREDGMSMQDVSRLSRRNVTRRRAFLEDMPRDYRDLLMSVTAGQSVGPLHIDGGFAVAGIVGRFAPGLDDEYVIERARRVALDRATRQAVRDHVQR
jgi:hypothetical protein